jgi:Na+/H+ antiporter NhaD/arsenite permease-like protein
MRLLFAAGGFDVAPWAPAPFVLLLLAIALLPLAAGHWWHSNRNRLIVSLVFALPVAGYLLAIDRDTNGASTRALLHELKTYASFVVMLTSLYVISGGIVLSDDLPARPRTNVTFLALGAVLANVIGTTGASMVLVRPLLRTNRQRKRKNHVAVFFIFIVANTGGLLTPLGDPPLFLGYLEGVPFDWTLRLWPQWLAVNLTLLAIFYAWDARAYRRESAADLGRNGAPAEPLRLRGWKLNAPLFAGVIAAIVTRKYLPFPLVDIAMAGLTAVSLWKTPRSLRESNRFTWGPILEVAILFLGIFVCMVPAIALLQKHGGKLGLTTPLEFFWVAGGLSAVLDNAPTYVTLGTLAATVSQCDGLAELPDAGPDLLAAVSCGAVFLGALTYIGNGPNFMVKALAEESGYRMPTFFGYMAYSSAVLLPVFGVLSWIFFR